MVNNLQKGQTINVRFYYVSLLRQLRENIKVKCHGKLSKGVLSHQDNALAHTDVTAMAAINDCGSDSTSPLTPLIYLHQTSINSKS